MFTSLIWYCRHKPKLEGKAFQEEKQRQPWELVVCAGMPLWWGRRGPGSWFPIPLAAALQEGNLWLSLEICSPSPSAPSAGPAPLLLSLPGCSSCSQAFSCHLGVVTPEAALPWVIPPICMLQLAPLKLKCHSVSSGPSTAALGAELGWRDPTPPSAPCLPSPGCPQPHPPTARFKICILFASDFCLYLLLPPPQSLGCSHRCEE